MMLFSIPESGWLLIAVAATAFFMASIRALAKGMRYPDERRGSLAQHNRQGMRAFYLMTTVFAAAVLAANLLRPAAPVLFLYSVAFVSIPIAIFPVRARILRDYIAQQQNPDTTISSDRLMTAWIVGFLLIVTLVAVLTLQTR